MIANLKFSHKVLLAASLVVVAAFSLFTLYNDSIQRRTIRTNLENHLEEMSQITAASVQAWLSGRLLLVDHVAQTLANDPAPESVTRLLEQKSLLSTFTFTYLGRRDGGFAIRPKDDLPADYDPRTRPWYIDAMAAGGTTLTEPYLDVTTGQLMMTIATPVSHGGQALGVVGGDLTLETMANIVSSLDLGGIGYAFLVNADGKVLVHPDKGQVMKQLSDIYPQKTPTLSTHISETEQEGKPRILMFSAIKGLPSVNWYVGLSIDKDKAYEALGDFRASAILAMVIAVALTLLLLGILIRVLMQPLRLMGKAMRDIAQGEGDLTRRLDVHSKDEFGTLAGDFNLFVERIQHSIREVSSATTHVNEVARRVMQTSSASMANSDEQANRTHSIAAAINELGAAAQEIARNAGIASHQASDARVQAEGGRQIVTRTIHAMDELSGKIRLSCSNIEALNGKTENIGRILEVIKGISEQTNLLALNAAIEAARAGEAGRGFAVVADEVRSLAYRTQTSAQEIHTMIEELQVGARAAVQTMSESERYSKDGVMIAYQAGERLSSVTDGIGQIDGINQSVAAATEEQTSVIDSLNVDITQIKTLNEEGVQNLQATLQACDDLERQATRLKQWVDGFRT
ncbi:chemotaxis protein [Pseudomonas brassicacearum]|uniref:Chemotaxis protein n=4 Tax=Pseudomonas TaxID=286 RepID=A0A0G3GSL3_9PSED|nr:MULTISPECIES: methyl-accepting chemotaxis protein [Pseudomonas]AKK01817.1 chemotaxis protein [Pseudomonas chlororaphis]KIQ59517.1 chemotaxis protein [Pseudomonas fluorescens]ROM83582.1 chemotaxis protein [Pseudomonas brassicacearum]